MSRIDITLAQLEALVAVRRTGGFARAALQLGMSQSAVSHAVAALERQLDLRVLVRGRGRVSVPGEAQAILEHAEAALAAVDRLRAEARRQDVLMPGRLRLGTFASTAVWLVPQLLGAFKRACPQVEVTLFTGHAAQLRHWLATGIVDVSFVELAASGSDPKLVLAASVRDPLFAVLPRSSPWTAKRGITMRMLAAQPMLLSQHGCEELIERAYAEAGTPKREGMAVADMATLMAMVSEGVGATLLSRIALPRRLPGVVALPVVPAQHRRLALATVAGRRLSPIVTRFLAVGARAFGVNRPRSRPR